MKQLNPEQIPIEFRVSSNFDVRRLLAIHLNEFDWPARIENVFKEHRIITFADLVQYTEFDLRCFHNIGYGSVNYIKECLRSVNLRLGMSKCPHCGEFVDLPVKEEET
jgi:DNA-directed RNA polymerase alpha subunit